MTVIFTQIFENILVKNNFNFLLFCNETFSVKRSVLLHLFIFKHKMLIGSKIIPAIAEANQAHSKIAGCLFIFNTDLNSFEMNTKSQQYNTPCHGYLIRFLALLLMSGLICLELLQLRSNKPLYSTPETNIQANIATINVTILLLTINLGITITYFVQWRNPQDYLTFLNGLIQMEQALKRGRLQQFTDS